MRSALICLSAMVFVALGSPADAKPPKTAAAADATPLDQYVQSPDAAYKWEVVNTVEGNRSKTVVIKLTSQAWRGEADVDRPVWEHWLIVVKPATLKTDKAFLVVGGGGNDRPAPDGAD